MKHCVVIKLVHVAITYAPYRAISSSKLEERKPKRDVNWVQKYKGDWPSSIAGNLIRENL